MTIFLIILAVMAGVVILLLLTALLTRRDYAVERNITIYRPAAEVFEYVRHLKNMEDYNKWVMADPIAVKEYRGTDGSEGFVYAWNSKQKQAGAGEQLITKIVHGKRMDIQITFFRPFAGIANSYLETEAISPVQTSVRWGFASKMSYPMNAMLIFMNMGEILGKDLDLSLENLKLILEDNK
ncbi:polyketide cyclase [Mucilaginibacter terrenus]|uniref:Polyketide cyclase n=1 Tax=Mucilaginibacter terrenus TaxID=2482727 RepID=A0A3E2NPI9_9SPHI|nr:SRPBCC family protein [Mucilaginibacter terrenus]RFZ82908.1 polyketide cyclase [Mucilaginibacter terrenus]